MQRTILLGAAAALAALLGLAPYGFGLMAEKTYQRFIERPPGPGEPVPTAKSYVRGWFSSRAQAEIRVDAALLKTYQPYLRGLGITPPDPLIFTADEVIGHGPWPLAGLSGGGVPFLPVQAEIHTTITPDPATREFLAHFTAAGDPYRITRTLCLGGSQRLRFQSRAGKIVLPAPNPHAGGLAGGASLLWEGVRFSASFSPNLETSRTTASAGAVRFLLPGAEMSFQAVEVNADSASGPQRLKVGATSTRIGSARLMLTLRAKDSLDLSAGGLKITTSVAPANESLKRLFALEVNDLGIAGKHYGPGVYTQEIRHLDPAALARLEQAWPQPAWRGTADPDEERALLERWVGALLDVARHSPELEVTRLSLKTEDGEIHGKAKVSVRGDRVAPAGSGAASLLGLLDSEAEIVVPAGVLEALMQAQLRRSLGASTGAGQTPNLSEEQIRSLAAPATRQKIQALVALNYLVEEEKNYRIRLSYKEGRLLLNGQPLPQARHRDASSVR
jgi:uncharacterized protein YdgA (DUF945 family)